MGYVANLSTLYRGLPLAQRAAAARADGYTEVESWWDFDSATPEAEHVEAFVDSIRAARVHLIALNSHGGDRTAGERGLASRAERVDEFQASIDSISEVAEQLGTRLFNVAAGNRNPTLHLSAQLATAEAGYRHACEQVGRYGGTILIEALGTAENPAYLFSTGYDVVDFLHTHLADVPNIGLLFDTYHLAANDIDLRAAWKDLSPAVRHLQLADFPGRGAAGTGDIDFDGFLTDVRRSGYTGAIALEHLNPAN